MSESWHQSPVVQCKKWFNCHCGGKFNYQEIGFACEMTGIKKIHNLLCQITCTEINQNTVFVGKQVRVGSL